MRLLEVQPGNYFSVRPSEEVESRLGDFRARTLLERALSEVFRHGEFYAAYGHGMPNCYRVRCEALTVDRARQLRQRYAALVTEALAQDARVTAALLGEDAPAEEPEPGPPPEVDWRAEIEEMLRRRK